MERTFTLTYPPDSGFGESAITFRPGAPAPQDVFFADGASQSPAGRIFVTDANVAALPCMAAFTALFQPAGNGSPGGGAEAVRGRDVLLVLGAGEAYKTMDGVLAIVRTALEHGLTRASTFVAIGGGVICDMTAFAASMFKRGVPVEFVPTTLLAMVDAAVGGKAGCDFAGYKNMVGAFWPAAHLHVWSSFVGSLPEDEYRSGLGEALKTALLFSKELWDDLAQNRGDVLRRDAAALERVIRPCVEAKAAVVQEDFRERGRRAFLNLGHTFGHALESVAGLGCVAHGAAVAWGTARAAALSLRLGLCPADYAEEVAAVLEGYGYDISPLPAALAGRDGAADALLAAMRRDKKNVTATDIRVVLQRGFCSTELRSVADADIRAVLG